MPPPARRSSAVRAGAEDRLAIPDGIPAGALGHDRGHAGWVQPAGGGGGQLPLCNQRLGPARAQGAVWRRRERGRRGVRCAHVGDARAERGRAVQQLINSHLEQGATGGRQKAQECSVCRRRPPKTLANARRGPLLCKRLLPPPPGCDVPAGPRLRRARGLCAMPAGCVGARGALGLAASVWRQTLRAWLHLKPAACWGATHAGVEISVRFTEVRSSRGRMPATHTVRKAATMVAI
jgi:hypothetical protein